MLLEQLTLEVFGYRSVAKYSSSPVIVACCVCEKPTQKRMDVITPTRKVTGNDLLAVPAVRYSSTERLGRVMVTRTPTLRQSIRLN